MQKIKTNNKLHYYFFFQPLILLEEMVRGKGFEPSKAFAIAASALLP